jgi:hypothetical protein
LHPKLHVRVKVADHRAEAGAAVERMQHRGETLATIAELAGVGVGELRDAALCAETENHGDGVNGRWRTPRLPATCLPN